MELGDVCFLVQTILLCLLNPGNSELIYVNHISLIECFYFFFGGLDQLSKAALV